MSSCQLTAPQAVFESVVGSDVLKTHNLDVGVRENDCGLVGPFQAVEGMQDGDLSCEWREVLRPARIEVLCKAGLELDRSCRTQRSSSSGVGR